jgi:hypothetical protein
MITILKPNSGNDGTYGKPVVEAESVDAALEQVVERVTADEPELMALAEDLRFLKDPAKGEHRLESGYVLVVD